MPEESGGAESAAAKLHERFRDATEDVRKRADLAAKGLAGLGSTALAAIGLAKIGDLFPFPPSHDEAQLAAFFLVVTFLGMAAGLAFFTYRLWKLNQPIVLNPDVNKMSDLTELEKREVRRIYQGMAARNEVESFPAFAARIDRLRRIAARVGENEAKRYSAQADEIEAEVLYTQSRAAFVVIRRRAANAIADRMAAVVYGLLAVSILIFASSADYLESERTSALAVAKECAALRTAAADADLPQICDLYLRPQVTMRTSQLQLTRLTRP